MAIRDRTLHPYIQSLVQVVRWRLIWALFLALAHGGFEGVGVLMLAPILAFVGLDHLDLSATSSSSRITVLLQTLGLPKRMSVVLTVFLILICARHVLVRIQTVFLVGLNQRFILTLQERLYRAITGAGWLFFTRTRLSDFMQVLTADLNRVGNGTHYLIQMASTGTLLGVYGVLAFYLSPGMTGVVVVCSVLVLLALWKRMGLARESGKQTTQVSRLYYGAISEHLGGMKVTKSFGAEKRNVDYFVRTTRRLKDISMGFLVNHAETQMWFSIGSVAVFCGFLYVAVEVFHIPVPDLLLLMLIFGRMMPRVASLQGSYQQLLYLLPAYESFRAMEDRCLEAAEVVEETVEPLPLCEHIQLHKVCFQYQAGEQNRLLKDIDVCIPARKTTALVGPSGGGKTTLADLLMGLLIPDAGEIRVDGQALTPGMQTAWRKEIGYVPQETFLFNDTVRANLLWANPDTTEDTIWNALELSAAADFVRVLPQGLDTEIGERGIRLSGGERQRLALARALLIEPKLLVLDEATSHLDAENERRIQKAIDGLQGEMTIVVIAHRLSTVRHADQIVVIEAGRVVETGTWESLLGCEESRFYTLSQAQDLGVKE